MAEATPQDELLALENYLKLLDRYEGALSGWKHLTPPGRRRANALRDELARLQPSVEPVVGQVSMREFGRVSSAWDAVHTYDPLFAGLVLARIQVLKDAVRHRIQHLQTSNEPSQTNLDPATVFHGFQLHPKIVETTGDLYKDGHYSQAILEAFKTVINEVKRRSGLASDGQKLMGEAFGGDDPLLKLNRLQGQSDRDEQAGFNLIYMGAMLGIRNPKAHDIVADTDPGRALEYLALASLLMGRVDEASRRTRPRQRRDG